MQKTITISRSGGDAQEKFQADLDMYTQEGYRIITSTCGYTGAVGNSIYDCEWWMAVLVKDETDPLLAPTKFLTGLDAIIAERRRQYDKGRTIQYDLKTNINGELQRAAEALLTHNENKWPAGWNFTYYKKWITYPPDRQLAIVAALLSAEIDRISPSTTL